MQGKGEDVTERAGMGTWDPDLVRRSGTSTVMHEGCTYEWGVMQGKVVLESWLGGSPGPVVGQEEDHSERGYIDHVEAGQ